jgi:hypothetical protein
VLLFCFLSSIKEENYFFDVLSFIKEIFIIFAFDKIG